MVGPRTILRKKNNTMRRSAEATPAVSLNVLLMRGTTSEVKYCSWLSGRKKINKFRDLEEWFQKVDHRDIVEGGCII